MPVVEGVTNTNHHKRVTKTSCHGTGLPLEICSSWTLEENDSRNVSGRSRKDLRENNFM